MLSSDEILHTLDSSLNRSHHPYGGPFLLYCLPLTNLKVVIVPIMIKVADYKRDFTLSGIW